MTEAKRTRNGNEATVDGRDEVAQLERSLERFPARHKDEVRAYLEERRANGIKEGTLLLDAQVLRLWSSILGEKDFRDAEKKDVIRFVNAKGLDGEAVASSTVKLRKITVRVPAVGPRLPQEGRPPSRGGVDRDPEGE